MYKILIKKKIKINKIILSKKFKIRSRKIFKKKGLKFLVIKNLKDKGIPKILNNTDLGLICGFPHIFKRKHFTVPTYGLINLHAGKLPKYRGGSPLNWQILNDEKFFGISVIKINKGIDTGDIIFEKKFRLLNKYRIEDLHRISNKYFPKLLYKSIFKIVTNTKLKKQNHSLANYFRQRTPKDSLIKIGSTTYKKLFLLVRATSKMYQNPYFIYKNKKITIRKFKISKRILSLKIIFL